MTDGRRRQLVPSPLRELPADLVAVVVITLLADIAVLAPVVRSSPVRVVLGFAMATFVPGYAVVSALFPAGTTDDGVDRATPSGAARAMFAVSVTLVVVPGTLFVLSLSPLDIRLEPFVVGLTLLTLGATAVATLRRRRLPPEARFAVPYRRWLGTFRDAMTAGDRAERATNVALVVLVVAGVAGVTYAVAAPSPGEPFTEFYVLADDPGEPEATEYPTNLTRDSPAEFVFVVENHEHERREYAVVVELHRVEDDTVVERDRLDRFETTLAANATWQRRHAVTPTMTGNRLRLTYLLYIGGAPPDAQADDAGQRLHVWVDVRAP